MGTMPRMATAGRAFSMVSGFTAIGFTFFFVFLVPVLL
jgi:hypothetical protein